MLLVWQPVHDIAGQAQPGKGMLLVWQPVNDIAVQAQPVTNVPQVRLGLYLEPEALKPSRPVSRSTAARSK